MFVDRTVTIRIFDATAEIFGPKALSVLAQQKRPYVSQEAKR